MILLILVLRAGHLTLSKDALYIALFAAECQISLGLLWSPSASAWLAAKDVAKLPA